MSDTDEYLAGILEDLKTARENKEKGLFRINVSIPDEYGRRLQAHFAGNTDYTINIRKCMACQGTWDIIILFNKAY
jgi:hypothetical protein